VSEKVFKKLQAIKTDPNKPVAGLPNKPASVKLEALIMEAVLHQ
jgi:hypothetical protein